MYSDISKILFLYLVVPQSCLHATEFAVPCHSDCAANVIQQSPDGYQAQCVQSSVSSYICVTVGDQQLKPLSSLSSQATLSFWFPQSPSAS